MSSPTTAYEVWFLTGSSSGFGRALTLLALRKGHKVIATSRNPSRTPELVQEVKSQGGTWLALDVTAPEKEVEEVVQKAIGIYGRIDVLVNCAGYALIGAFETIRCVGYVSMGYRLA
jgi:NAD(P)-dependent dehydrogenase (short-subunit alcohol dehydrogenase family)